MTVMKLYIKLHGINSLLFLHSLTLYAILTFVEFCCKLSDKLKAAFFLDVRFSSW